MKIVNSKKEGKYPVDWNDKKTLEKITQNLINFVQDWGEVSEK